MLFEKTYTKNEVQITYYELGEGPTLLFLHGVGIRALTYKRTLLELAKSFKIIAPDLPGFGKSAMPPTNWNFTDYAIYLSEFLSDLKVEKCIVVGHSLGGRIAIELCAQTNIASHLILIDTSAFSDYYINSKYHLLKLLANTSLEILLERNPVYAKVIFDNLYNLTRNRLSNLKLKKIIDQALKIEGVKIREITTPTLILWGDKDRITRKEIAYQIQEIIKNSRVKIVNGNHAWCFTKPQILLTEITHFLNTDISK